tara:strand:- start:279 stop:779 length:501 start_codon:yes stop_codon:yes gene_type:complete
MSNFVGYKPSPLSILVQGAKNIFKSKGKNPTPGTINTVPIAKNLTTKRNIQDKVVAAVDKGVKAANVPPSLRGIQSASKMKKEKSRELKNYSYTADKITENKAKGGRVGLKRGTFPDLNKDGKTTFADVLIGRGVLPKGKKKKMMAKKSETPMDKSVKKKNKKRII